MVDKNWSPERVREFEECLTKLVTQVKEVVNPESCSYSGYRDYKIMFSVDEYLPPLHFYLEFNPCQRFVHAWCRSAYQSYPVAIIAVITRLFPRARYVVEPYRGDYTHNWIGISEQLLRSVTEKLA